MTETSAISKPKQFLVLAKSGIVYLVVFTAAAGYLAGFSFEGAWSWLHFTIAMIGVGLLSAGSAAINQIQEVHIDRKMPRTQNRPLPTGKISIPSAWIFSSVLVFMGATLLALVNWNVFAWGLAALFSYNVLYTLWWKKHMAFGAVPGAIPGALPILMGYQAANPDLTDPKGYYLFAILFMWQMPHFWVLALKYADDYNAGGFPILPVAKGVDVTRNQIIIWSLAYAALGLMAVLFFPLGPIAIAALFLTGAWVLWELFQYIRKSGPRTWLRFFLSVNFSLMIYLAVIVADLWSVHLLPKN